MCIVCGTFYYKLSESESSIPGHEENERPKSTMNHYIATKILSGIITCNLNSAFHSLYIIHGSDLWIPSLLKVPIKFSFLLGPGSQPFTDSSSIHFTSLLCDVRPSSPQLPLVCILHPPTSSLLHGSLLRAM